MMVANPTKAKLLILHRTAEREKSRRGVSSLVGQALVTVRVRLESLSNRSVPSLALMLLMVLGWMPGGTFFWTISVAASSLSQTKVNQDQARQGTMSLGEFYPLQDVTFDVTKPDWNGQPIRIEHRLARGRQLTIGRFRSNQVVIPPGVTIRFRGFDVAVFESLSTMQIIGNIDVSGKDGKPGTLIGGGDGGDGGGTHGVGQGGGSGGLGGEGWSGYNGSINTNGPYGENGAGPLGGSPGDARHSDPFEFEIPCEQVTGGGSGAGGGNGTPGADGRGHFHTVFRDDKGELLQNLCVVQYSFGGMAFGRTDFNLDDIEPSGGGDGGDGPGEGCGGLCGREVNSGGGGGGGGAGGAIVLQAAGQMTISGAVRANGGNGGDGAPGTFSGGGGGGAGGFILIEADELVMNGGSLEARGGNGGRGQNGAFDGGGGGGGRIHILAPCREGPGPNPLAAAPRQASCPVEDLDGEAPTGSTGGLPTVVAQQGMVKIEEFKTVCKDEEKKVRITVEGLSGQDTAKVNLEIMKTEGEGEARFDNGQTMKKDVTIPAGGKEEVIKGVKASSQENNLKLIARLASDENTKDEKQFSVVAVQKLEWIGTDGQPIKDKNNHPDSNARIGVRIFPDAMSSTGGPQNKVKVQATIVPGVNDLEVFFRSLDVDDPSTDPVIDPNDMSQDNHGQPPDGKFEGTADNPVMKKTMRMDDKKAIAEAVFEVTMQPGDNFRVVVTCMPKEMVEGNKVKARQPDQKGTVEDAAGNEIKDDDKPAGIKATEVLTVWRMLHVEVDSMADPPNPRAQGSDMNPERNFIQGNAFATSTNMQSIVTRLWLAPSATQPPVPINDGSPHLSGTGTNQGNGRFERGTIHIGTITKSFPIIPLDGNGVGVLQLPGFPIPIDFAQKQDGMMILFQMVDMMGKNQFPKNRPVVIIAIDLGGRQFTLSQNIPPNINYSGGNLEVGGVEFTIVHTQNNIVTVMEEPELPFRLEDDDQDMGPYLKKPDEGDEKQNNTLFSLMQTSDKDDKNRFAVAYVKPVYDLTSSQQPPFNRNVDVGATIQTQDQEARDQLTAGRDAISTPSFWRVYIQGSLQEDRRRDLDPDSEAIMTALGWTPDFDSRGSLIFVEVARDAAEILKARGRRDLTKELLLRITVLHEVGHQFGLGDNTGGIMDQGMFDEMRAIFTSAHIKEIRKNTIPGGNRP
jgi:hypothetical protein